MSNFFKGKKILVTGGTGLIGRPLVDKLVHLESKVTVVSLDKPTNVHNSVEFINLDLRNFENCLKVCRDKEIVFNLIGVKGSPKMTMENPASFFTTKICYSGSWKDIWIIKRRDKKYYKTYWLACVQKKNAA